MGLLALSYGSFRSYLYKTEQKASEVQVLLVHTVIKRTKRVGPCHHIMVRTQVAEREMGTRCQG